MALSFSLWVESRHRTLHPWADEEQESGKASLLAGENGGGLYKSGGRPGWHDISLGNLESPPVAQALLNRRYDFCLANGDSHEGRARLST